jgi:hypothetical protein
MFILESLLCGTERKVLSCPRLRMFLVMVWHSYTTAAGSLEKTHAQLSVIRAGSNDPSDIT